MDSHLNPEAVPSLRLDKDGFVDAEPVGDLIMIAKANRETSGFLQLPREIRNKIYGYAFRGHTFRLLPPISSDNRHSTMASCYYNSRAPHRFALLPACRRIYSEARLYPFKCNMFQYTDLYNPPFVEPAVPLLRAQVAAIQHVDLLVLDMQRIPYVLHDLRDFTGLDRIDLLTMAWAGTRRKELRGYKRDLQERFKEVWGRGVKFVCRGPKWEEDY